MVRIRILWLGSGLSERMRESMMDFSWVLELGLGLGSGLKE